MHEKVHDNRRDLHDSFVVLRSGKRVVTPRQPTLQPVLGNSDQFLLGQSLSKPLIWISPGALALALQHENQPKQD